jgi:hypothetical protein
MVCHHDVAGIGPVGFLDASINMASRWHAAYCGFYNPPVGNAYTQR